MDENQAELEKRTFVRGDERLVRKSKTVSRERIPEEGYFERVFTRRGDGGVADVFGAQKPKNLVGCLSFRGYLPRKPDEMKVRSQQTTTSDSDDTIDCNTKTLLMLAGESDPLVPVRWTKEAKVKAELLGLEAHAFFSEGYGHKRDQR